MKDEEILFASDSFQKNSFIIDSGWKKTASNSKISSLKARNQPNVNINRLTRCYCCCLCCFFFFEHLSAMCKERQKNKLFCWNHSLVEPIDWCIRNERAYDLAACLTTTCIVQAYPAASTVESHHLLNCECCACFNWKPAKRSHAAFVAISSAWMVDQYKCAFLFFLSHLQTQIVRIKNTQRRSTFA